VFHCRCLLPALLAWPALAVAQTPPPRDFAILAVNDIYRIEGVAGGEEGGLDRLASLRRELERDHPQLITLHAGDLLYPSLMSRRYRGAQMISTLNVLDRDPARFDPRMFITFGNHEFDAGDAEDVGPLTRELRRSQFTWLGSGVRFRERVEYEVGSEGGTRTVVQDGVAAAILPNLRDEVLISAGGVWIGIFGLTMPTPGVAYVASFLDTPALQREYARARTRSLRSAGAEFVVALTHLTLSRDLELARELGPDGPDLIVGGHDHGRVHEIVAGRHVVKADAEGRSANLIQVTLSDADVPRVTVTPLALDSRVARDPEVADTVDAWVARHDREFCADQSPPQGPDCLDAPLARLADPVVAEEIQIRTEETAFGRWVAAEMVKAIRAEGGRAGVAVVNAGALRLNQDLPEGTAFTRRHLEELIQFDGAIHEVELTGEELRRMMELSARCVGSGPWLQFTGLSVEFDPAHRRIAGIEVAGRPLQDSERYPVILPAYLAGGGDGYTFLTGKPTSVTVGSLKRVLSDALSALGGAPLRLTSPPGLSTADLPGGAAEACPNP
jgi:2',3'-cyclic-nucleotide 2'-phosphodiesterase (5'-nucleotidase family)